MPAAFSTLLEMLAHRAAADSEREAFRFDGASTSFAALWLRVRQVAAGLLERQLNTGEPVVVALPNGASFFAAFYGVQLAGGIPVPCFPGSGRERLAAVARRCGARTTIAARPPEGKIPAAFPPVAADDLAYIQYTSGSTGEPKGVELTHRQVLTNVRQLIAGLEITAGDRFVSWLPVYHDMGLVLMTMVPFYLAAPLRLLPASLRQLRTWLREIGDTGATFTAAPDFGYRFALRAVRDASGHDLSSLRVALNAAEPVRASTVRAFETTFGLSRVMVPGYGLAEATVGVAVGPPGRPIEVDERGFVSVGPPLPGVELAIVRRGRRVEPGEEGEVVVASPANTRGYRGDRRATARLFWRNRFLRTGDVGRLDRRGRLWIVGRRKSLILQAGRNLAPREVEEIVDALEFVRGSAAIGVDRGGLAGEQLVLFVEPKAGTARQPDEMRRRAIAAVAHLHTQLGLRPARLYLARPGAIPRTANGKVRYGELRRRFLDGELRRRGLLLFPDY